MEIKAGCKVRVSLECNQTEKDFGINDTMRSLFGTVQTASYVNDPIVQIRGWDWHIKDLILVNEKPQKKIPITHFDPEYLEV